MSHMQAQVEKNDWIQINYDDGETAWLPIDVVVSERRRGVPKNEGAVREALKPFTEFDKPFEFEYMRDKWGARLSAPGYLDCTEWCVFESEDEAKRYIVNTYEGYYCDTCLKPITESDRKAYEAEGGEEDPTCCEDCAEVGARITNEIVDELIAEETGKVKP